MRRRKRIQPIKLVTHTLFVVLCFVCLYPILLILFNAISSESHIVEFGYVAWPKEVTLVAFKALLRTPKGFLVALFNSIIDAVVGPTLAVIVQSLAGYALMQDDFVLKKPIKIFYFVAMFLPSGGLIPAYIINTEIFGFENNYLAYILPGAVTSMGVFLYRTFFRSIPKEILESAAIDGASDMQIWGKMMIPLSKSFIATQFFLGMSGRWKEYTTSLYYMSDTNMQNLEYYIQQIIKDINMLKQNAIAAGMDPSTYPAETVAMATVFFSLIPIMIIFPLLQKYFEKGATVGSVKG